MKNKLFIYPTGGHEQEVTNPYISNMREALSCHFDLIVPTYKRKLPRMLVFLLNSLKAEVYVLSWIENSAFGRGGLAGALMSMLGLFILKIRKVKIIWIFHNKFSHEGDTIWTQRFRHFLFRNSTFIVSHSEEAADYARQQARCPVYFKNHPMKRVDYGHWNGEAIPCDFFFWGSVLPYKGVVEFLSNPLCKTSGKRIRIVGKCKDLELDKKIKSLTSENVIYENRIADYCEITEQCKKTKYVIFPYIGDSVSSSGVLMDTLLMGGTPVGPNRGAFADLAKQGCCLTYNSIDEVFNLPTDNNCIVLNNNRVKEFIDNNTWDAFGKWISETVERH